MNALVELRQAIIDCLNEAGIRTVDYSDTRITPPLAIVQPSPQYLIGSDSRFGGYDVSVDVLVVGPSTSGKQSTQKMDEMILEALDVLDEDFNITEVTAPGEATINGNSFYGAVITIEATITLRKRGE